MANTIRLLTIYLLSTTIFSCSSSDDESGVPPDSSIFNVTLDGQEFEMKTGFDHGEDENCWSYASALVINEDYNLLNLQILSNDDIPDPNLFFGDITFELLNMTGNGQGARTGSGAVQFDVGGNSYYNYEPEYPDNSTRRIEVSTSAINFNIVNPDFTESVSHVVGTLGVFFTTLDDMESHELNIDFDIKTQGAISIPDPNSGIIGKWVNLNGCTTASGTQAYFQFNADGTGSFFNADCTSSCTNNGVFLYFNFEDNGSEVDITYTSVSSYCGQTAPTPQPETLSYSISGDRLSLAGATWTKE